MNTYEVQIWFSKPPTFTATVKAETSLIAKLKAIQWAVNSGYSQPIKKAKAKKLEPGS